MIIAFHGLPGTATDLQILQKFSPDLQICGVNSIKQAADFTSGKENVICMGYSRGSQKAMEYALQYPVSSVLLISPHWGKRISPFLRALLRTPFLGTFLLRAIGPGKIQKMLRESALPQNVPAAYQMLENVYAKPSVLREALLELAYSSIEMQSLAEKLQVPIYVIAGECDKDLSMAKDLLPYAKNLTIVPNAGHALPWTHGSECIKILNKLMENL